MQAKLAEKDKSQDKLDEEMGSSDEDQKQASRSHLNPEKLTTHNYFQKN